MQNTTLSLGIIRRIARLTDNNCHGDAMQMAAEHLGAEDLVEQFREINHRHVQIGHLSDDLYQRRMSAYVKLMDLARKSLDAVSFEKLHAAF